MTDKLRNPHAVDLGDGYFALHIKRGGNAVIVNVGKGTEDIADFREWAKAKDRNAT